MSATPDPCEPQGKCVRGHHCHKSRTLVSPLEQASRTLDDMAARLEIIARTWRSEADYMRNGDHVHDLGTLPGREARYADAASRSLLRGLAAEVGAITRKVQTEIPAS